jgi:hypothetical protein
MAAAGDFDALEHMRTIANQFLGQADAEQRKEGGGDRTTALNDRGVRTARGGAWHDSTVRNLLARAG